jgi:hypothetical protein
MKIKILFFTKLNIFVTIDFFLTVFNHNKKNGYYNVLHKYYDEKKIQHIF